jgi:aminoglycoside 6'-N-acetyltransferase
VTLTLRGDEVTLRALSPGDLDALIAMFAEPAVAPWWPRYDGAKIEDDLFDPDDDTVVYAIEVAGEVAGVIQSWEETDDDYRHAGMDIAVATRFHGRGVAVDALRTLARHLVTGDGGGHHRLVIDPALANERAIGCYEKVGFRRVGVMRKYERGADGSFHDSLLMDLLAEELA